MGSTRRVLDGGKLLLFWLRNSHKVSHADILYMNCLFNKHRLLRLTTLFHPHFPKERLKSFDKFQSAVRVFTHISTCLHKDLTCRGKSRDISRLSISQRFMILPVSEASWVRNLVASDVIVHFAAKSSKSRKNHRFHVISKRSGNVVEWGNPRKSHVGFMPPTPRLSFYKWPSSATHPFHSLSLTLTLHVHLVSTLKLEIAITLLQLLNCKQSQNNLSCSAVKITESCRIYHFVKWCILTVTTKFKKQEILLIGFVSIMISFN